MSKKQPQKQNKQSTFTGFSHIATVKGIEEYQLKSNGLRVLYMYRPRTGVVTTNITYLVGARDEQPGETGIAHMLEHMLFKPTHLNIKNGIESGGAMQFERDTGCIINANTWKDRTTYFFSYPVQYFEEALKIEADRMNGVVLSQKVLLPEQGNVLSEFDMYNGDPHFALAVQMCSTAFHSHPYGHETIGYREDIESYTADKLDLFYKNYYRPDNATLMVIGDIDKKTALKAIKEHFSDLNNPRNPSPRYSIKEPKQEGLRRIYIERPSSVNIVSIGFKHEGFPSKQWYTTQLLMDVLCSGPESILHTLLIDSGKASSIDVSLEPNREQNLASINITLSPNQSLVDTEKLVLEKINSLTRSDISSLLRKAQTKAVTDELFARTHSLHIAQELTEYVASGDWRKYHDATKIITKITPIDIISMIRNSFISTNLTIGHFVGKQ